jgi:hypothetical protein
MCLSSKIFGGRNTLLDVVERAGIRKSSPPRLLSLFGGRTFGLWFARDKRMWRKKKRTTRSKSQREKKIDESVDGAGNGNFEVLALYQHDFDL